MDEFFDILFRSIVPLAIVVIGLATKSKGKEAAKAKGQRHQQNPYRENPREIVVENQPRTQNLYKEEYIEEYREDDRVEYINEHIEERIEERIVEQIEVKNHATKYQDSKKRLNREKTKKVETVSPIYDKDITSDIDISLKDNDLIRGIIVSEILGKPKSLQNRRQ